MADRDFSSLAGPQIRGAPQNPRPTSSPRPRLRPERSLGDRMRSGIRSIADRLNLTGPPTAGALAARDRFMNRDRDRGGGSSSQQQPVDQAPDMTDQYAENLRRYNEYMKNQQRPQQRQVTPEMRREALNIFESQQGAGQIPYYMAAARQGPNASPAFNYAAQNYATLGGSQRLAPRPMEMMSVAERQQINRMAEGMAQPPQIDLGREVTTMPMPSPQQDYQRGMDMVMRGGKGGPRTGPQLPPGMVGLPRTPDYGGRPQQPPSRFSPFMGMLASRFGGFGGY